MNLTRAPRVPHASATRAPRVTKVVKRKGREGKGKEEPKVPPSSDAEPASVDFGAVIFGTCLEYLIRNGVQEKNARKLLGKWRKGVGDGEVIKLITEAETAPAPKLPTASMPTSTVNTFAHRANRYSPARGNCWRAATILQRS